MSFELRLELLF